NVLQQLDNLRTHPVVAARESAGRLQLHGEPTTIPPGWAVRPRQAGDRIRPRSDGSSQKLKHFFQVAAVPPWLRPGIPVLEWDGEAVALGDWVLGHRLREWLQENELEYTWEPIDPVLARLRSDCRR
ncbi:MAG: tRNA lysidine(34) synthetase TilS, partial [Gammaproteobacteria bacterium]